MPPQLASIFCFSFILFCLSQESKNQIKPSPSLWLATVWYFVIASRPIGIWLNINPITQHEQNGVEGSPANTIFLIACTSLALIILLRRKISFNQIVSNNLILFVLLFYTGMTFVWSDFPFVTLRRWIKLIYEFLIILTILTENDPLIAIRTILRRLGILTVPISILLIKYYPHMGTAWSYDGSGFMWTGVALHKNQFGFTLAVYLIYFFWELIVGEWKFIKKTDWFLFGLAIFMIITPGGKGSMAAVFGLMGGLAIIIVIKFFKNYLSRLGKFLVMSTILYLIIDVVCKNINGEPLIILLAELSGRDPTFTGRTDIWESVINSASNNFFLGPGYGVFWTGNRLLEIYEKVGVTQSHNGFVEAYANIGFLGLIILSTYIVVSFIKINTKLQTSYEFEALRFAIAICVVCSSFFEAAYLLPSGHRWIAFLLSTVIVPVSSKCIPLKCKD